MLINTITNAYTHKKISGKSGGIHLMNRIDISQVHIKFNKCAVNFTETCILSNKCHSFYTKCMFWLS